MEECSTRLILVMLLMNTLQSPPCTPISSPRDLRVGVQSSNKHFTNNYRPTDFCSCSVEDSNRRYAFDPFNHSTSWLVVRHAPLPKERFLKRVGLQPDSFFLSLSQNKQLFVLLSLGRPLGHLFEATLDGSTFRTRPIGGKVSPGLWALGKDVIAILLVETAK